MKKRLTICTGVLLLLLTMPTKADDPKVVTLSGDAIQLSTETQRVEASGNVAITYGITITANAFSYDPKTGDFALPENYTYKKDKNIIHGHNFFYNVKTYKGESSALEASVDRLQITGEHLDISPLHIKIRNATFTTCQMPSGNKHYRVVAKTLFVYPAFGYLVAFNSNVYVRYLPFGLPVPAFIYGAKRYGLTSVTSLLPDMGIDRTKGIYVEQKIPYFKSNSSNGGALVGFTEKLGWFAGVEHIETFNKSNSIETRAVQYSRDTFSGTATYRYIIGGNSLLDAGGNILERVLKNFNAGLSLPQSQALLTLKYRDILNDQRVSYLPMAQYEINNLPLPYRHLNLTAKTYFGKVVEDQETSNYSSWTGGATGELWNNKELRKGLDMRTALLYYGSWYQRDISWQRYYLQWGFQLKDTLFKPQLLYTHNLIKPSGSSPFLHEQQFALTGDELGLRLDHRFERWKNWEILQVTDYGLEDQQLRNCDFSIGYRFHCWQMSLRWRAVQQAFALGFTIY